MPKIIGSIRRLVFTPSLAKVGFRERGFDVPSSPAVRRLEAIPQSVIVGFEWAIDTTGQWEVERRLDLVEPEMQGFAYEGATMAFTVLDAMSFGRGWRARDLLRGPAEPHLFLAYIGIGFAMARLPRPLWHRAVPDLHGSPYYPTLSWLAVDGYGFDRAYFDTRSWVDEQRIPSPYAWEGDRDYFLRAVDQGIGRALWFIHGAQIAAVSAAVRRFASQRQADLWSGVGLAAAFAGGTDPEGLAALRRESGEYHADLAQGTVFAAKARSFAGFVPSHTEAATARVTGLSIEDAAALAERASTDARDSRVPAYESWRRHVRQRFASSQALPQG